MTADAAGLRGRRIALCHEWLTTYGGSEQVAQRMAEALDVEHVYTFTAEPALARELFGERSVRVLRRGGGSLARRRWQWFLPLMPGAWRGLDLGRYDVVITSSHAAVNAIRIRPGAHHISYCHTPMHYAWEWRTEIRRLPLPLRPVWPAAAAWLRRADRRWAARVTQFIAPSRHVADRIGRWYGREAEVIPPPVDTRFWTPDSAREPQDYFLFAGRLVTYKRPDVAVEAAKLAGVRLLVAGSGPELPRLRRMAGPGIEFLGERSPEQLRDLYRGARAFVHPGVEHFGMTMVEAQACGTPVVAFGRGGAREAVQDGTTGILYPDPSPRRLATVLRTFDHAAFKQTDLRSHAERFDSRLFDRRIRDLVAGMVSKDSGVARRRRGG